MWLQNINITTTDFIHLEYVLVSQFTTACWQEAVKFTLNHTISVDSQSVYINAII